MQWHRELTWNPHDLQWRIALLFMVGSFLFALGSFPPYSQRVDARIVGITFVLGSIFFTSAAYSQLVQIINDPADPDRSTLRSGPGSPTSCCGGPHSSSSSAPSSSTPTRSGRSSTRSRLPRRRTGSSGRRTSSAASRSSWRAICSGWPCATACGRVQKDNPDWWGASAELRRVESSSCCRPSRLVHSRHR